MSFRKLQFFRRAANIYYVCIYIYIYVVALRKLIELPFLHTYTQKKKKGEELHSSVWVKVLVHKL